MRNGSDGGERHGRRRLGKLDEPETLFAFRLALELGIWDVPALMRAMPYPLFLQWVEFYKRDPFGRERGDLNAATIAAMIANAHSSRGKRYEPRDFMPEFYKKRQSVDDMVAQVEAAARAAQAMGGRKQ